MHTVGLDLIRGLTYRLKKMTGNNWGNLNVDWILEDSMDLELTLLGKTVFI